MPPTTSLLRVRPHAVFVAALTVGLLWLFFRNVAFEDIGRAIAAAHPAYVGAALLVTFLTYLIRARRWQALLAPIGPTRFRTAFRTTVIGFAISFLIPRAGEVVRPYLLARRESLPASATFATIIVERLLDLVAVLLLFGLALPFVDIDIGSDVQASGLIAALVALAALVVLFLSAGHPERLFRRIDVVVGAIQQVDLQSIDWIAGQHATREGVADPFVDRLDERGWNRTARDAVHENTTGTGPGGYEPELHVRVLPTPLRSTRILHLAIGRPGQHFPVEHPRTSHVRLDVELALQAVKDDLEVLFADTPNDNLAGVLIRESADRRILAKQLLEPLGEPPCIVKRLRRDDYRKERRLQSPGARRHGAAPVVGSRSEACACHADRAPAEVRRVPRSRGPSRPGKHPARECRRRPPLREG